MLKYTILAILKSEGNKDTNFYLIRQEVETIFTAIETTKITKEIQVARLLKLCI